METKNIIYFIFELKNSMKKTSFMNKDSCSFSKPSFGCYFCRSLVNFKNLFFSGTYEL